MKKRSRVAIGVVVIAVMTLGVGGFLARAQIGAIMTKSPARDRPFQRAQEDVIATFRLVGKAMHDGDGALFLGLLSRKALAGTSDTAKVSFARYPQRPDVRLEPVAVCVRGDQAFVVATYEDTANKGKSYLVRYTREDGAWKIADQAMMDAPPYRPAVYAYLPPEGGAFIHAGSPWRAIGYATPAGKTTGSDPAWKIQATRDEAFLYVRFEAKATLPAPGMEISAEAAKLAAADAAAGLPTAVISVTGPDDNQTLVKSIFALQVARTVAPRRDDAGKTADRHVVGYTLTVRGDRDEALFGGTAGAANRLVEVRDRFIDVRIPLKSLGLHGRIAPDIEVTEFAAPAQILPYKVARFSP
jgi:hypothetical protein